MSTQDRVDLFYVMLGSCCEAARLGGACVRLELDDGTWVEGVPAESALADGAGGQIDHTGTRHVLHLDHRAVELDRVRRYSVTRPG